MMKKRYYPLILVLIALGLLTQTCTWEEVQFIVGGFELQQKLAGNKWNDIHTVWFDEEFYWPPGKFIGKGSVSNLEGYPRNFQVKATHVCEWGIPYDDHSLMFRWKVKQDGKLKRVIGDWPGVKFNAGDGLRLSVKPKDDDFHAGVKFTLNMRFFKF